MSIRISAVLLFLCFSKLLFADSIENNGEMIVTASLSPVSKTAVGSAVTIITSEDIEKRGITFIPDILRDVPGLAVNRSGTFGTQTDIRVRGAEANHTLVLIDGIEVNDPSFGSSFQAAFLTTANIERIEIIRGAQSALWGSDAIGAVINIITKKGAGPLQLNGGFEGGSFDTQRTNLSGSYANSLFNINLNADVLSTDGTNIARDGNEDDGHHNRTYDLKLGITPHEILDLSYVRRVVKSDIQTDPKPTASDVIVDAISNQTVVNQVYQNAKATLSLFDDRWVNHFSFVDTKNRTRFASTTFGGSFLNGDKQKFAIQSDLSIDSLSDWNIKQDFSLLFEHEDDNAIGSFIGSSNTVGFLTKSYVGEYRIGLLERVFISTGIRHDDSDDFFEDQTTYRVTGAIMIPESDSRLHASYGTGIKNPSISELFGNFPTFTGNPNLTPETSRGWDIGVEQSLFNDSVVFDVTYFRNLISDQITGSNNTVRNSAGTNKIYGVEISFSTSLYDNLDINGAYTYTRTNDVNNLELVRRPKHIGSMNLNYRFYQDKANLDLGVNYHGRQQDTVFPANNGTSFRTVLGAYTLVDFAANYDFNKYVSFHGRIENLFDESYEEVFGFTSPGIAGYAGINLTLNP